MLPVLALPPVKFGLPFVKGFSPPLKKLPILPLVPSLKNCPIPLALASLNPPATIPRLNKSPAT